MSFTKAQIGNRRTACVTSMTGSSGFAYLCQLGLGLVAFSTLTAGGCARRAYNDVYVENMAAEIRDLEDQLYEFDGEYRVMEQQLAALKSENERLRSTLPANNTRAQRQELIPSLPSDGLGSENFVPRGSTKSNPVQPNKPATPSPAPSLDLGPLSPSNSSVPKSIAPELSPGSSSTVPKVAPPSNAPPLPTLPPTLPGSTLPAPKPAPGAEQFNPNDLAPPKIDLGEPMPPTLPPPSTVPNSSVTMQSDNDLELELGQIKIPAQLASARSNNRSDEQHLGSTQIHPAATLPADTRIVEIKFHPSLCRAVNTDQQGDDDGLYLVLQPYNSSGEFVPLPADLMIVALDLSRDEKQATIGRWTLSANDVKAKLNPIGSSQGIHLSLSFSGPAPQCDRVLVFAYYTLPDGRRVVAEQEVMLNNLHRQNAVWVPRGKNEVRQASHAAPVRK